MRLHSFLPLARWKEALHHNRHRSRLHLRPLPLLRLHNDTCSLSFHACQSYLHSQHFHAFLPLSPSLFAFPFLFLRALALTHPLLALAAKLGCSLLPASAPPSFSACFPALPLPLSYCSALFVLLSRGCAGPQTSSQLPLSAFSLQGAFLKATPPCRPRFHYCPDHHRAVHSYWLYLLSFHLHLLAPPLHSAHARFAALHYSLLVLHPPLL
mmetsp:Transcript_4268/g.8509  ORF Transcript_4268/g.8509 Transcript_4268/m.8509 type:complete len:211 (+) Transcript_4268:2264-2896(+)